ncbi:UDP-N-acetylmuramoyl-L-alanyl-D-glutamate--2,6-diaminopimelate ligase [Candidatus Gracilibacteria bacterium]|nr:UDP-N-acetylmuramoyl-L-alanyl-D-glutamate--2,6-diaminopimelate ligase [Candidatus Gracilibacteria bacterium]
MPPMLLSRLLTELGSYELQGEPQTAISHLAYDSRQVQPGSLFVAIKGYHVDGHAYIPHAVAGGAAAVVVDAGSISDVWPHAIPLVRVPNSRTALAPLAAAFYDHPGRKLRTIGITGTKGKSTTTDLVNQVLAGSGAVTGMISTVDFQVAARRWANDTRQSTPEALDVQALLHAMVEARCSHAIIEATSHALSPRWNRLGGCAFASAVFLNVTHEHLDYHGSFEHYRDDKAQLFRMLAVGSSSTPWAIANADDPSCTYFLDAAPHAAQRLTFGLQEAADVRASAVRSGPSGSLLHVCTPWGDAELALRLPGTFNIMNALAALSVALTEGVELNTAIEALSRVRGVRGRMQPIVCGQPFTVIVDYAHNPDSFEQVLAMLRPLTTGRVIAVFGSAGERDRAKRPLQGAIAARYCDLLVLTDEDPRGEDRATIIAEIAAGAEQEGKQNGSGYLCIPDRAAAIGTALAYAQADDLVLLLGKGHESCILYADHKLPWDEAAEAEAALRAMGYVGSI